MFQEQEPANPIVSHLNPPKESVILPQEPVKSVNLPSEPVNPVNLPSEPVNLPPEPVNLPSEPVNLPQVNRLTNKKKSGKTVATAEQSDEAMTRYFLFQQFIFSSQLTRLVNLTE